jgi:hypothetical protein
MLNPAVGRIALGRTTIVAASVKNAVTTGWIGHDGHPPVGFCRGFASGKMGNICGWLPLLGHRKDPNAFAITPVNLGCLHHGGTIGDGPNARRRQNLDGVKAPQAC